MTSGREIKFVCYADIKSVARTFVAKLLHRDLQEIPRIPDAYKRRIGIMTDAAKYADDFADEPRRREVREVLKEVVDEMRRDIACYRASLALHDTMIEVDVDPGCTREELIAEMAASEARSLAFDMNWATA
jgi:hypothetical protein